jgi:hypothetical protein
VLSEEKKLLEKKESYTPMEAKRAYHHVDRLVAQKALTARQVGAHRKHIAGRVRVVLKSSYSGQAAKRAKAEIARLTEVDGFVSRLASPLAVHPDVDGHQRSIRKSLAVMAAMCSYANEIDSYLGYLESKRGPRQLDSGE